MPEIALQLSELETETIEVISKPPLPGGDLGRLIMGLEETEMSGVESVLLYAYCGGGECSGPCCSICGGECSGPCCSVCGS